MSAVGDQTRHRAERDGKPTILRPNGTLVWIHFETADQIQNCAELIRNLRENYGSFFVLVTSNETIPTKNLRDYLPIGVSHQYLPEDTPENAKSFLDFWRPDICIWASDQFNPNILSQIYARDLTSFYVNATPPALSRIKRLLPNKTSQILRRFTHIYTTSDDAQDRAVRAGVSVENITVAGALKSGGITLECDDALRSQFSAQLAGRPTWFACNIGDRDIDAMIAAQKHTARRAQGLLLIVGAANDVSSKDLAARFKQAGFRVEQQEDSSYPRAECQVFIARRKAQDGIWFRVSPVSFFGSGSKQKRDPMAAAAFGSAIISQGAIGLHAAAFSRLADQDAMMRLKRVDDLADALKDLIAPDRAAAFAQAAWAVQSEGAMATDQIANDILDHLDQHASAA